MENYLCVKVRFFLYTSSTYLMPLIVRPEVIEDIKTGLAISRYFPICHLLFEIFLTAGKNKKTADLPMWRSAAKDFLLDFELFYIAFLRFRVRRHLIEGHVAYAKIAIDYPSLLSVLWNIPEDRCLGVAQFHAFADILPALVLF
jgi:hypothetical protein